MGKLGILQLTDDEFEYLHTNIKKLYDMKDKLPPKIIDAMGSSLDILHRDLVENKLKDIKMRRHERRVLQAFLKQSITALEKSIIPGYVKRMNTPKSKTKYKPYVDNAKTRRDMIKPLLEKIEAGL